MTKVAVITGITGQDGSYLAELLLNKGYEVYGIVRRTSLYTRGRLDHLHKGIHEKHDRLNLLYGDVGEANSIYKILKKVQPHEVYHLAAQSHVRISFDTPEYTGNVTGLGTVRMLEAIRDVCPDAKFYQASSSEMFGKVLEIPQKETTPFNPRSPYGCAKVYSYFLAKSYREGYGMFACNGILFNHESPRRGLNFVTRKITKTAADIVHGLQKHIIMGNLDAQRDWGYAPEYVEAMWLMLQQKEPDDYIIATGKTHSVKEFLHEAFTYAGLKNPEKYIRFDPRYYRPAEVDILVGDARKAREKLGWEPKMGFKELIHLMVDADLENSRREAKENISTPAASFL